MNPATRERILDELTLLYDDKSGEVLGDVEELINSWIPRIEKRGAGWSEQDVFLITYGDSIRSRHVASLELLQHFLIKYAGPCLSMVHILPFYPYTSDDGFSVVDFREVDPDLGEWKHVEELSDSYRLVYDAVINHVSQESRYVEDHLNGGELYRDFVIEEDPDFDSSQVTRPRTSPLFHEFVGKNGPVKLWTTFSRDQVDLNYANPAVLLEILDVLLDYACRGASMVRLDAIPYMWKKSGTNCVHLPQTHGFIRLVRAVFDAACPHVLVLSETNVPHQENLTYFGNGSDEANIIYNFTLAPLIIFSLTKGDATALTKWASTLEQISDTCTYLNISATHDGIGMRPTEGILDESEREILTELAKNHGGSVAMRSNPDGTKSPYELNLTFFDALNNPNDFSVPVETQVKRFLAAQAITFVLPGIPGIYIHSLLGSRNDYRGRDRSGIPRRINREKLDAARLEADLSDTNSIRSQVLKGMLELLRVRQRQPAFHPNAKHELLEIDPRIVAVKRVSRDEEQRQTILALTNVSSDPIDVETEAESGGRFVISGRPMSGPMVHLDPYEVCWIEF
ncbi:MAG: sugar phosphorylase [Verrucomicrobiota bacterium]